MAERSQDAASRLLPPPPPLPLPDNGENDLFKDGEDRNLTVDALLVDQVPLEAGGVAFHTLPPALASIDVATHGRVVIDCVRWDTNERNALKGRRFASALLRNVGAAFAPPEAEPTWIGPSAFEPVGDVPYFRKTAAEIALVAAGTVEAEIECASAGTYTVFVNGRSDPALGVFAKAGVTIDDRAVGEVELKSSAEATFLAGVIALEEGAHLLRVQYTNDLYAPGQDRNLYVTGIGFRKKY
jgi:hypothetical protein